VSLELLFLDFKSQADDKRDVYGEDLAVLSEKYVLDVTPHRGRGRR
jgi:hypothetical protein